MEDNCQDPTTGDGPEPERVFQLGYASAATVSFDDGELLALLDKARVKNAALGVTGMLLYHDGSFIQVLEGRQEVVEDLYATIAADPRHTNALLLFRCFDRGRSFGDWTMGFHRIGADGDDLPDGLNRFLQTGAIGITAEQDGDELRQALLGFRAGRWRRLVHH